jgi:hypothetical protein
MTQEFRWTRARKINTLAGISIVREAIAGGDVLGPLDATEEVKSLVGDLAEPTDADALMRIVAGLATFAAMLVAHVDSQAGPEPDRDTDPEVWVEPRWSRWLREVEQTVRDLPVSD